MNGEASFLFPLLNRLLAKAAAALRVARSHAHAHHHAYVEGALAGILGVAALSLSGSAGFVQQVASDPIKRTAQMAGGALDAAGFARITAGMSPYAVGAAKIVHEDRRPWAPSGVVGWAVYDMSHPPNLVRSNLSFDEARVFNALVAPSALPAPSLKPFVVPSRNPAEKERALLCLTQAVYYESGFETGEGQQAVAQVVLNRLRHPAYPKSVCGVVYQGSQRVTGCQFSFTCDGSLARVPGEEAWKRSQDVARRALAGFVYKPVGTSTHYHADYVFPYWAVTLVKLTKIGTHIFYRMTGPSGAPSGFTGRYAGNETALSASILTGGDARTPDAPSAVEVLPPTPAAPPEQTITLTVGGETRTYTVGATGAAPPVAGATATTTPGGGAPAAPAGVLTPTRRAPTPEEIRRVNEVLQKFEQEQAAPQTAPAPDAPRTNPRPRGAPPPATTPVRPLGGGTF